MKDPWAVVPLGKVMAQRKESIQIDDLMAYKRCRVQLHAHGIVLRDTILGAEIKTKKQQVCHANDFLVAEIDAKVGGFGIVPERLEGSIVSSHYFLFDLNEKSLDRRFLDYFIRTKYFQDQVAAQGSTNYAAIRPEDVLRYAIPLPALGEQCSIMDRIEELAARIEEARGLRRQAMEETEVLKNSVKNTLVTGHTNGLWPMVGLGEIADIQAGVTLGRSLKGEIIKLPYLRVANVQDGYLNLNKIKEVEILASERGKWQLQKGDILLTEGGDWDKLGRGAVWNNEMPNCIHQNHIFRLRVNLNEFNPEYLCALIGSSYGKKYFQAASKQTTNLASINQRQLKAFLVCKPPLQEQNQIAANLKNQDAKHYALKRHQAETAAELDALLPAVLERAFRGEI
ncbi:MAG: Restriction endonuclease subunit [Euryarchaeota archaeon]|nr:Restriction endonuclease subunit [Euryarchaeota archaeon]